MDLFSMDGPSFPLVIASGTCQCELEIPWIFTHLRHHLRCVDKANGGHLPPVYGTSLCIFATTMCPSWSTLWWSFGILARRLEPKNARIQVYNLSLEFHKKWIWKLSETCIDTQRHFKAKSFWTSWTFLDFWLPNITKFYTLPIYNIITHLKTL